MSDPVQPAPVPQPLPIAALPDQPVAEAATVVLVEAPAPALPESAPEAPAPVVRRKRAAKPQVSDETLSAYQAALERDRRDRERVRRAKDGSKEQAEAFRLLRQAVKNLDAPAEDDDELARRVREAPARVRTVIAATLDLLGA